jgi:exportin-7
MAVSNSVNSLCEYLFKVIQKGEKLGYQQAVSPRMSELLQLLLEIVLTEDNNFMWTLSKPLLGLIIVCEGQYEQVRDFCVQKATPDTEKREKLVQAFAGLMSGVSRSLESRNRDKFARNFSELRQAVISLG